QDHVGAGAGRGRRVRQSGFEEAVRAAGVDVIRNDLTRVIDTLRNGARGGQGIVDGGVKTPAVEEAVLMAGAVQGSSDDLAGVVDADRIRAVGGQGVIKGGVSAVGGVVEEAVVGVGASNVKADDLSCVVDAEAFGEVLSGQRIGNRGVSASTVEEAVDA